ncbi:tyrosine recombinase XerC [Streptomyces sp. NPDC057908]|uniref:site-specific integrase n=1 Tax=Streptomyces sp. NPDC057908 TaxID=3346276 RepID=UPI0036F091CC
MDPTSYTPADPQYAAFLDHRAKDLAVSRCWSRWTCNRVKCGLMVLAALHQPFEKIRATTVHALARHAEVAAVHLIDMLDDLDLLLDDAPDTLGQPIDTHLAPLPEQIRSEAAAYFDVLRDGTARRRPRTRDTVDVHLRMIVPFTLEYCTPRYSTLRQVTRNDLTEWISTRQENVQREVVALRDLFKVLKAQRLIFADPARGIRPGAVPSNPPTPLPEDRLQQVAAAARDNPTLRVVLALAGIHALFPREIRLLQDSDIDMGTRRLRRGGTSRPLDGFTAQALREYQRYRDARWPKSSNPHLLRTQQTALREAPVSKFWLKGLFKNLPATADSLRQDRVLEEATAVGPDPLHIATMFNLSAETSLRYTRAAAPEDGCLSGIDS